MQTRLIVIHHYVEPAPGDPEGAQSAAHWATGIGTARPGECHAPVLAQISNARGDQVRIPMQPAVARTLVQALHLASFALPGTSLRAPVPGGGVEAGPGDPGDGFAVYALAECRVRLDFRWEGAFTALQMGRSQVLAFTSALNARINEAAGPYDPAAPRPQHPGAILP